MDAELNLFKGKTFTELTQGLTKAQKDYLYFRLMGEEIPQALAQANRSRSIDCQWKAKDTKFGELEEYLLKNRLVYFPQAAAEYNITISAGLRMILHSWVNKGLNEPEKLSEREKDRLLKLAEMLGRVRAQALSPGEEKGESYEGRIKRLREGENKEVKDASQNS